MRMRPSTDDTSSREYTIGDLAAKYGVSLETLRFYEEEGLLQPVHRGRQRVFSEKDRIRLQIILLGRRLHLRLPEIWKLIQSRNSEPREALGSSGSSLGLDGANTRFQIEHLTREREGVQRAIEELRTAASTAEGSTPL